MTTRKYSKSKQSKKSRSKKEENEEDCPICFDKLKKKDNIPKLKCKHKFHKQCLEPICRQRDNENVPCPLCRRDISFECASNITRNSPWKYSPHTNPTPFTQHQMMRMSDSERRQHHNEIQRHRRNYLARRRRTIARETSAQRTAREQREQELETQRRQEMENFYNNNNNFSPRTPDTPPSSNRFIPRTPDESPPLLTMEDLRTSPSRTPPPLTMDDLRGGRRKKPKTKKSNYISMTRQFRKSKKIYKAGKRSIPRKYVPKRLSKKDKKKQLREIKRSRKAYKNRQYHTRKKVKSFKSKKSAHILNAERIYKVNNVRPGNVLAKKTGCSVGALRKIVKKGQGAYFSSGSRPNQSAHSWGYARLASSITGGKSAAVDFKVLSERCKKTGKAYRLALKSKKKHGFGTRKVSKF